MKILDAIKTYFIDVGFTSYDISLKLNIDTKVCAMVLKKYHNSHILSYYSDINTYYYLGEKETIRLKQLDNENIDKYNLKQKSGKYKYQYGK